MKRILVFILAISMLLADLPGGLVLKAQADELYEFTDDISCNEIDEGDALDESVDDEEYDDSEEADIGNENVEVDIEEELEDDIPETNSFDATYYTCGDYEYTVDSTKGAKITDYTGSDKVVSIPSTLDGYNVFSIYDAFSGNATIEEVTIPDTVTIVDSKSFYDCAVLKRVTFSKNITKIGGNAFRKCASLSDVTLPSKLTEIGDYAFADCSSLKEITIPASVTDCGDGIFKSSIETITFSQGMIEIPENICYSANNLMTVNFPTGLQTIGYEAFYGATSLTSILIPTTVTEIDAYAFQGCKNLKDVSLPPNLVTIGSGAFLSCASLTETFIPKTVTYGGSSNYGAFEDSGITKVTFESGMVRVPDYVMRGAQKLTDVSFPSTIKEIGQYSFTDCYALKNVTLPSGLTTLNAGSFSYTGLTDITIPKSLTTVNGSTGPFYYSKLTEASLEYGISAITNNLFRGAYDLVEVIIPTSVTSIGQNAFYLCSSLKTISIPSSVKYIGKYAFQECKKLETIDIPANAEVGELAFDSCFELTMANIGAGCKLGKECFNYCKKLKTVKTGDNVSFGDYVFEDCDNLKAFKRGKGYTNTAKSFCGLKMSDSLSETVTWVYDVEYGDLSVSGEGEIPDNLSPGESSLDWAAEYATVLNIEEGITSVGKDTFCNMNEVSELVLPRSVVNVKDRAFSNCKKLKKIEFGKNVQEIGSKALSNNPAVNDVIFTGSMPSIKGTKGPDFSNATVQYPATESESWTTGRAERKLQPETFTVWDDTIPLKKIVLLLDVSGSMRNSMATLKEAVNQFIDGMNGRINNAEIAIVFFDDYAYPYAGFSTGIQFLHNIVNKNDGNNGGTEYTKALTQAKSMLDKDQGDVNAIIMFSDGEPNDDKSKISMTTEMIRNAGYTIYTVGIGGQDSVLKDISQVPENHFEMSSIDELIERFKDVMKSFQLVPETEANLIRHGRDINLLEEQAAFAYLSPEEVVLTITPKCTKENQPAKVEVLSDGAVIYSYETGRVGTIKPGVVFAIEKPVTYKIYNKKGECYDTGTLLFDIREHFYAYFDDGKKVEKKPFINGVDFEEPDIPAGDSGKYFEGWHEVKKGKTDKALFFSPSYHQHRLELEDDVQLKAQWDDSMLTGDDVYSFGNSIVYFGSYDGTRKYEISNGDYMYLIGDLSNSERSLIRQKKNSNWSGSDFGMALSVCLAKSGIIDIRMFDPKASTVRNASMKYNSYGYRDVSNIESMINFYELSQYKSGVASLFKSVSNQQLLDKIKGTGYPFVLGCSGSTVVGYDLTQTAQSQVDGSEKDITYRISIYDPDYPGEVFYLDFVTDPQGKSVKSIEYPDNANGHSMMAGKVSKIMTIEDVFYSSMRFLKMSEGYSVRGEEAEVDPLVGGANGFNGTETNTYVISTNYSDFNISDGTKTSTVMVNDDATVSGGLSVTYLGKAEGGCYEFEVSGVSKCEITPKNASGTDEYVTNILGKGGIGFFASLSSEQSAKFTAETSGKAYSHCDTVGNQSLTYTSGKATTSWYELNLKGSTKGFTIDFTGSEAKLYSETSTNVFVGAYSDLNDVEKENVSLDSQGITVKNDATNFILVNKNGITLSSDVFGYSVSFDSYGGTLIDTLKNVPAGSLVEEPDDPQREGFDFQGWFTDTEYKTEWDFEADTIKGDTVLYAAWSQKVGYFCGVYFHVPGGVDEYRIYGKGQLIPREDLPEIPRADKRWYKDIERTEEWNFDTDVVMGEMTLFSAGEEEEVMITFKLDKETVYKSVPVQIGKKVTKPADPTMEGKTFAGWVTENGSEYNFNEMIIEAVTLYASWVDIPIVTARFLIKISDNPVEYFTFDSQTVFAGEKIVNPGKPNEDELVLEEGEHFSKWATSDGAAWNFDTPLIENVELYAVFTKGIIDKSGNNTGICITINGGDSFDYTGANITPEITVTDDGIILEKGVDYKVSYKNNKNVTNKTKALKYWPTITVTGIGNYKAGKSLVTYFSIEQRDMSALTVTLPTVVAKSKNAKQTVKPTVKCGNTTISASLYKTFYYTDAECTNQVTHITAAGDYYIVCEAVKNKLGEYSDQLMGTTNPVKLEVLAVKPKDTRKTLNKKYFTMYCELNSKGKKLNYFNYDNLEHSPMIFSSQYWGGEDYEVTYLYGKTPIAQEEIKNAGSYTAVITGKGNYKGTVKYSFKINPYDIKKALTNNQVIIREASSAPSSVVSPTGCRHEFSVHVTHIFEAGAFSWDYDEYLKEGRDYSISFANNKAASTSKKVGYATIKGKGNFTGTIKGDGKPTGTVKNGSGITKCLNFPVYLRELYTEVWDDDGVHVGDIGPGVSARFVSVGAYNKKLKNADAVAKLIKAEVYVDGKKISTSEYSIIVTDYEHANLGKIHFRIKGNERNYTGISREYTTNFGAIKASDTKKVKAKLSATSFYYSGSQIRPDIKITDAAGNDISNCFVITYGTNTKVGTGTVIITGREDMGYTGEKKLKFTIKPKWAKWKF